jgi:hypothetical protein
MEEGKGQVELIEAHRALLRVYDPDVASRINVDAKGRINFDPPLQNQR